MARSAGGSAHEQGPGDGGAVEKWGAARSRQAHGQEPPHQHVLSWSGGARLLAALSNRAAHGAQ